MVGNTATHKMIRRLGSAALVLFSLMTLATEAFADDAGASSSMGPIGGPSTGGAMTGFTTGSDTSGTTSSGMADQLSNPAVQQAIKNGMGGAQLRALLGGATAGKNNPDQTQQESTDQKNTDQKNTQKENPDQQGGVDTARNQFQDFVFQSIGKDLPIYGHKLFNRPPSTFAPLDNIPVPSDYVIGPGDEVDIHTWGPQLDLDYQLVVDRNGGIDIPRVGRVNLSGMKYSQLHDYLKNQVSKSFRHIELSSNLGKLRSIQVFVLGQARRPGVYTVSSLSTLVNTLFASGGPSVNGSMRHIQLKRGDKVVTEMDLYDLLLKGDKSKDVGLLPGDVIYIPPVGKLAAISGSLNTEAIFELKDDKATLADLIDLAGGMTTVATGEKVRVERIDDHQVRSVDEFSLDKSGMGRQIRDGDLVEVGSVGLRFENAVTLRGNVASPGRYPWKTGMRVKDMIPDMNSLIVPGYWAKQNQVFRTAANESGLIGEAIKHDIGEINWDYAVIERMNKIDLSTSLHPFNLGKAIANKDSTDNLLLESGDVISIFSKQDIRVPIAQRSTYVRLDGEVGTPGIYEALPGETLRQLVTRIGGLTPNAYIYGAEFDRASVRAMQQEKLNQIIDKMEEDVQRNLSSNAQNALSTGDLSTSKAQATAQETILARMRKTKATGRVVLGINPDNNGRIDELPDLVLEDGDSLNVPARPAVVSVMGMVYNQNTFLYHQGAHVGQYLDQAGGPTRDADSARMYLLHADGSVMSAQNSGSFFGSSFTGNTMYPGDAVIVPETLDKTTLTKDMKDWTQIFYQFALGVAGLKVLGL